MSTGISTKIPWIVNLVFVVVAGLLINFSSKLTFVIIVALSLLGIFFIINLAIIRNNSTNWAKGIEIPSFLNKIKREYYLQSSFLVIVGLVLFIYTCQTVGLGEDLWKTGISLFLLILSIIFYEVGYSKQNKKRGELND